MSLKGRSYEECLRLVCAVCTNLNGQKASRGVSESEVKLINKYAFSEYKKDSLHFPQVISGFLKSI